jgi:hypothetical protein
MQEITIKVSDSQFENFVSYLSTLSYVELPPKFKKQKNGSSKKTQPDNTLATQNQHPIIASLGEMDNTPWDIEYVKQHHSIDWSRFQEVVAMFKEIPLENHIEEETKPYFE